MSGAGDAPVDGPQGPGSWTHSASVLLRVVLETKPHAVGREAVTPRWQAATDLYNARLGKHVKLHAIRQRLRGLYRVYLDATKRATLGAELRELLAQFHHERTQAVMEVAEEMEPPVVSTNSRSMRAEATHGVTPPRDMEADRDAHAIVLFRAVLETKPYTRAPGILKRWQATAELYRQRLDPDDPHWRVVLKTLRQRLDTIHKLYCKPSRRHELSCELVSLVAQYDEEIRRERTVETETATERAIQEEQRRVAARDEQHAKDDAATRNAHNVVLLRAVLEIKPYSAAQGRVLERWASTADLYNDRLGLVDPSKRLTAHALLWRTRDLHTSYCDPDKRETLTPEVARLVAQYDSEIPRKRVPVPERMQAPDRKRRRQNALAGPPAMLFKLDLAQDARMVRAYLDGAFDIYRADDWARSLLETAAATRGEMWSRSHVRAQLERLVETYRNGDPAIHGQSPSNQRLRDLLADYSDCVPKLYMLHKKINQGVTRDRRTLDDVLLEDMLDLRPFAKVTQEDEHVAWQQIAARFNERLDMKVMFTVGLCYKRFHELRDAWRAGGVTESAQITPNQDKWLREIEKDMASSVTRTPVAPPCEDLDSPTGVEANPLDLAAPPPKPHVGSVESKMLRLLLTEVVSQRPFTFGAYEMLVWDKIRAHVNFEMRHETISTKEDCRVRVLELCRDLATPGHAKIERLMPVHVQLLRSIVGQEGFPDPPPETREDDLQVVLGGDIDAEQHAELASALPLPREVTKSSQDRGRRGHQRGGRKRGRAENGDDAGPHNDPVTRIGEAQSQPTTCEGDRGQDRGQDRGASIHNGNFNDEDSLVRGQQLEDRINALSEELATIKKALHPGGHLALQATNHATQPQVPIRYSINEQDGPEQMSVVI